MFEALTTVADGSRRYDQYPSVLGVLEPTHGALMPGEYKLWEDHMRPWICPMRTCRTVFARLAALGMHFKVGSFEWLVPMPVASCGVAADGHHRLSTKMPP